MIELHEVSKSFGDVVAVSRLTMTAKTGVTGFLGPNGAGKSTTLKLIMGEIRPDAGIIRVFDENPINNAVLKRQIGYVSEHEDLYPWMKGKQFVSSLAKLILFRALILFFRNFIVSKLLTFACVLRCIGRFSFSHSLE